MEIIILHSFWALQDKYFETLSVKRGAEDMLGGVEESEAMGIHWDIFLCILDYYDL